MMKKFSCGYQVLAVCALLIAVASGSIAPAMAAERDNEQAKSVHFPDPKDAWVRNGTLANMSNLHKVRPGLDKDQLYDLLGRPHFPTGMFAVKEWDYLFLITNAQGRETARCQLKIVFDDSYLVQKLYWQPESCSGL